MAFSGVKVVQRTFDPLVPFACDIVFDTFPGLTMPQFAHHDCEPARWLRSIQACSPAFFAPAWSVTIFVHVGIGDPGITRFPAEGSFATIPCCLNAEVGRANHLHLVLEAGISYLLRKRSCTSRVLSAPPLSVSLISTTVCGHNATALFMGGVHDIILNQPACRARFSSINAHGNLGIYLP